MVRGRTETLLAADDEYLTTSYKVTLVIKFFLFANSRFRRVSPLVNQSAIAAVCTILVSEISCFSSLPKPVKRAFIRG